MRLDIDLPSFVGTACVAAMLLHAPAGIASAQRRFDGVWNVHYERAWRTMHDSETHITNESARMILRLRGDSVFGSWEPVTDQAAPPRTPSTVRGIVKGDSMHVEVDAPPPDDDGFFSEMGREIVQFLKTYVHGMPPMTPQVDVVARGDSLIGTNGATSADGSKRVPPRILIATRPPK